MAMYNRIGASIAGVKRDNIIIYERRVRLRAIDEATWV